MKLSILTLLAAAAIVGPASAESDNGGFQYHANRALEVLRRADESRTVPVEGASAASTRRGFTQPDADSPWEDINRFLLPRYPQVIFGNRLLSVDGLCVDGANLRPFNPVATRCVDWSTPTGERDGACIRTEQVYLSTPIRYRARQCVNWSAGTGERDPVCLEERIVEGSHALSYDVEVFDLRGATGERGERLLFKKRFDIKSCP